MKKLLLNIIYVITIVILAFIAIIFSNIYIFVIGLILSVVIFVLYCLIIFKKINENSKILYSDKKYSELEIYFDKALKRSICLQEYYFNVQHLISIYMFSSQEDKAAYLIDKNIHLQRVKGLCYYRFILAIASNNLKQAESINKQLQSQNRTVFKEQKIMANKILNMITGNSFDKEVYEKTNISLVKKICEAVRDNAYVKLANIETKNKQIIIKQRSRLTVLLNVVAVISFFLAIITFVFTENNDSNYLLESAYNSLINTWKFYLFIPLPLLTLIHGVVRSKKFKVESNIATVSTFIILLTLFGSFTLLSFSIYNTDKSYINYIEDKVKIDLPKEATIIQQDWTGGIQTSSDDNLLKYDSLIRLNSNELIDVTNFRTSLTEQEKNFIPALFNYSTEDFEYYIVYNIDSNLFFELDYASGTYYLCLAYHVEENLILVNEFYKK